MGPSRLNLHSMIHKSLGSQCRWVLMALHFRPIRFAILIIVKESLLIAKYTLACTLLESVSFHFKIKKQLEKYWVLSIHST
jgi:hypothetical protein